jgi:hypothetical protein
MKKMKPRMLCSWSFILGFINRKTERILNINIFKIFIGDFVYEVKLKFSFTIKIFRNPPNTTHILPTTFHFTGDVISKRVNSQQ